jgi:hypothetical protein
VALQTVHLTSRAGIDLDATAIAADTGLTETWPGTGSEFLYVNNGGASALTVTLTISATVDGQPVSSKTVSVPAGARWIIGPFPVASYNDSARNTHVSWSTATSVKVAVFRLGS